MPIELTIYSRTGCHLCEDMEAQLAVLSNEMPDEAAFVVRQVDIDQKQEWQELYGTRVPVLMKQDQLICEAFLDKAALLQALETV